MNINHLNYQSAKLRLKYFQMFIAANQGHPGAVFSQADLLCYLFYNNKINFKSQDRSERDKIIISKGHSTMGLYPILSDFGYFDSSELENFGKPNSLLKIFGNISIPGIDATSGSLGHGVGIGSGYAIFDKNFNKDLLTFVIISEGEMYEGSVWEAALFASENKLDNLILILDRNHKIILGDTEDSVSLEPIDKKWESFGFDVSKCNGHDFNSIDESFKIIHNKNFKPKIIIADTVKGKGIDFMENDPKWHYWNGVDDQLAKATLVKLKNNIEQHANT